MRIGIDGRELLGQPTGVGRYLASLCAEWLGTPDQEHHLVVYTPEPTDAPAPLGPSFSDQPPSRFTHRIVGRRRGTWWEQTELVAAANHDGLDVFFAPAYSAPLRLAVPCVVTMHDVSFAAHPEWFPWKEGARRRWLAARAMASAARVLTVSEFSKTEIIRLFDVAPAQVHVVYHGISRLPPAPSTGDRRRPLVLYAGSVFNRRHLPTLIRAFARISRLVPEAELAVVGADRTYPPEDLAAVAAQCGVTRRVTLQAYVPDEALEALYRQAAVFVFLSEYEGFGLPPLEALSAGVPVVVGDTPVAREVYGEAALFADPLDAAGTADAILSLLTLRPDRDIRARQLARAAARLPRFDWTHAAAETMAVLEAAARTRRDGG